jgi:hypothetical protein
MTSTPGLKYLWLHRLAQRRPAGRQKTTEKHAAIT